MVGRSLRTITFGFVTAYLQGAVTPLYACSCDTTPPPCRALWQADLVFSGRVDKIEYVDAPPEYPHYRVTFAVDQILRGDSASQLTIRTDASSVSCGYEFHEGESYVVYGYSKRGATWTSRCGRTRPLNEGMEDFDYAASLAGSSSGGRIYGDLRRWDDYLGRPPVTKDLGVMADVPIVVNGPGGPFHTRSRQDGTFEVTGLEVGSYRLSLELPDTLTFNGAEDPIRVASPHACERADVVVHFDGSITGTVQDAAGASVVGAQVVLAAAELADDAVGGRSSRTAVTDRHGNFDLRTIPPGEYVLGINIDPHFEHMVLLPGTEGRWIWPRVFHPGSPDPRKATRIELGAGEKRVLSPLRLPEDLLVRTVTGTAQWPDGRPVAEGWVSLLDADTKLRLSGTVRTTSRGEFAVAAFAGQRVFVQVEAKDNGRTGYVESQRFDVGGNTRDPITLTVKLWP